MSSPFEHVLIVVMSSLNTAVTSVSAESNFGNYVYYEHFICDNGTATPPQRFLALA